MTQDEIIRMAREAGDVTTDKNGRESYEFDNHGLKRFAERVAAHSFMIGWIKGNKGLMEAVREEREACAEVCDEEDDGMPKNVAQKCATAIRARGEK